MWTLFYEMRGFFELVQLRPIALAHKMVYLNLQICAAVRSRRLAVIVFGARLIISGRFQLLLLVWVRWEQLKYILFVRVEGLNFGCVPVTISVRGLILSNGWIVNIVIGWFFFFVLLFYIMFTWWWRDVIKAAFVIWVATALAVARAAC